MSTYVIGYDVGTTGIKTCIFEVADTISLVASDVEGYSLFILENGGAEQNPDDLWNAMCVSTQNVMTASGIPKEKISGISFCSQMQGLVLVNKTGEPVRPLMSYMDQRASRELQNGITGGIEISGVNIFKLMTSLHITGAVSASVKDPAWKYNWVRNHEPETFSQIYKWLDVKEYLILKCTDQFVMTKDSAFATMLYDTRKNKNKFSSKMCQLLEVNPNHLPRVINSADLVGPLTGKAAKLLGLSEGLPVFGGGGDASLIGIGAGAAGVGNTHIYSGTSGWVSTVVKKRKIDLSSKIASIVGADESTYNYFAELETSSKCLEWVKDHMALDEINIYLEKVCVSDSLEALHQNLYDFMLSEIKDVPAGSHGVVFTPWLHGNRCPFEDPNARGMFFNISLETGKRDMIHAVVEGICFHLRWQLEASQKKVATSSTIRFVGGGALAPLTCQIISDVLGCEIETVENPQHVGSYGAAVIVALGLGLLENFEDANQLVKANHKYSPNPATRQVYDRTFKAFKLLYKNNKAVFGMLNNTNHCDD